MGKEKVLRVLLHAHEEVIEEREEFLRMMDEDRELAEFEQGHINGLKEARNRIEELIIEYSDT